MIKARGRKGTRASSLLGTAWAEGYSSVVCLPMTRRRSQPISTTEPPSTAPVSLTPSVTPSRTPTTGTSTPTTSTLTGRRLRDRTGSCSLMAARKSSLTRPTQRPASWLKSPTKARPSPTNTKPKRPPLDINNNKPQAIIRPTTPSRRLHTNKRSTDPPPSGARRRLCSHLLLCVLLRYTVFGV